MHTRRSKPGPFSPPKTAHLPVYAKRSEPEPFTRFESTHLPVPEAYTVADCVAIARVGRTKIFDELKSGRLKSFVLCGRRLIHREDLLNWIRAARDAA